MKDIKKVEQAGRKTWLAGLGTVGRGSHATTQGLDNLVDDANHTFSALIERGARVEEQLKERFVLPQWLNQRIAAIRARLAPGQDRLEQAAERLEETLALLDKLVESEVKRVSQVQAAIGQTPGKASADSAAKQSAPAKSSAATKASPATKTAAATKRKTTGSATAAQTTRKAAE